MGVTFWLHSGYLGVTWGDNLVLIGDTFGLLKGDLGLTCGLFGGYFGMSEQNSIVTSELISKRITEQIFYKFSKMSFYMTFLTFIYLKGTFVVHKEGKIFHLTSFFPADKIVI